MVNIDSVITKYCSIFPHNEKTKASLSQVLTFFNEDVLMTDHRWIAYALATMRTECGIELVVRTEMGQHSYFDKYEPTTKVGKSLGNINPGDGFLYRGRGYVQITGKTNYQHFGHLLNLDLVNEPDLALIPKNSYDIMSNGMRKGLFTGKKFTDYIHGDICDYFNARRMINSLDRAGFIGMDAQKIQLILV